MSPTLDFCYSLCVAILLISNLVHSVELLSVNRRYVNLVFFREVQNKESFINHSNGLGKQFFCLLQIMLIILLFGLWILNGFNFTVKIILVFLAIVNLYSYVQRKMGRDGADQVRVLSFMAIGLSMGASGELSKTLPLFFVGGQLLLLYGTSGMAKVFSEHWRRGNVLAEILQTNSYGSKKFGAFLKRHPLYEKAFSHSAIFFMLFVPVSFILPFQYLLLLALLFAFSFHFATAVLMGLNDFLFTIPLMYPGVYYLYVVFHSIVKI